MNRSFINPPACGTASVVDRARTIKPWTRLRGGFMSGLDLPPASQLTGRDGSPTHEAEGNNREHGADDPHGTKTVAAPATVSGWPFILVALAPCHCANSTGRQMNGDIREPGDLPSSIDPSSRAGMPGAGVCNEDHQRLAASIDAVFPETCRLSDRKDGLTVLRFTLPPCAAINPHSGYTS